MARNKSVEEIEKSTAGQFAGWLYGKKDPLCGRVEMEKQEEFSETEEDIQKRIKDSKILKEKIYEMEHNRWMKVFHILYKILAVGFCLALIGLLLITVSYLPSVDDAERPVNNEVSARYIESGLQETGAINIVTGMILDYRAFDTFGESNVLFVATCTVLILLRLNSHGKEKSKEEISDRLYEPKNDIILQKVARILVPMIIVFGIYVVLNGHLSPGGGFSGGAIIGAGLILYLNAFGFAKTERFFTEKTYKWICFSALLFYGVAKSYSFFTGANHLESGIPLGTPGAIISSGLILPLNICVGMVVACTMYAFYALFRKGGF